MAGLAIGAKKRYLILIGAALMLQLTLVSWTFPLRELLTYKPQFWIDSAYHWYQMTIALRCGARGSLICYDPYFAAGYPAGVTYNWSAKLPALAAFAVAPLLDVVQTYKLYSFVSAVLAVACVPLACRVFRVSLHGAVVATVLGFLLWWVTLLRWYHTAGMVSFVLGSFVALVYVAFLYRFVIGSGGWRWIAGLAIGGALAMFYHPLVVLPVGFAIVGLVVADPRHAVLRRTPWLAIVASLSLSANLWWILPMLHFQQAFGIDVRTESPYQQIVDLNMLWQEFLGKWHGRAQGSKLYAPIALAAMWGCFSPDIDGDSRGIARGLALGAAGLALFAAGGAIFPWAAGLQPNRFLPVVYVLLIIPAAIGVTGLVAQQRIKRRRVCRIAAFATLAVLVGAAFYGAREMTRELSYEEHSHYGVTPPEVKGVGATTDWIKSWILQATDQSARVMFESSPGRAHDQSHVAGYLAATTDREFIGGPYPYSQFANFWEYTAFRRPIDSFTPAGFLEFLQTYNIGWIVAYSERSRKFLNGLAYLEAGPRRDPVSTYRVTLLHDYFLKGSGRIVSRSNGQLAITNVAGDVIILKYHYVDGLYSDPPSKISAVRVLDDPNPFIRIVNPPVALSLQLP